MSEVSDTYSTSEGTSSESELDSVDDISIQSDDRFYFANENDIEITDGDDIDSINVDGLTIEKLTKARGKSPVWAFFGTIKKDGRSIMKYCDKIFCIKCFENNVIKRYVFTVQFIQLSDGNEGLFVSVAVIRKVLVQQIWTLIFSTFIRYFCNRQQRTSIKNL